jgi:hydrogenase expression/formation protein HypE
MVSVDMDRIERSHGSGGVATSQLIENIFREAFSNEFLNGLTDAAVLPGAKRLAYTTDSYVVRPIFFRGGDIGRLAVCGTVNDLLTSGAKPAYITAGYILEEGLATDDLRKVAASMADAAFEAGVYIVTGDTKVVEPADPKAPGLMINTSGIGFLSDTTHVDPSRIQTGDAVIVSGSLGDHHAAILSERMNIQNDICSDAAPLGDMVDKLFDSGLHIHAMRDVTRGGLATILYELAHSANVHIYIEEKDLPISQDVAGFAGLLGLDPLYMGNEGKMVFLLPGEEAERAVDLIRHSRYGENAAIIGCVKAESSGTVVHTAIGGTRVLAPLVGEGLPRIC